MSSASEYCADFKRGRCTRGSSCRYLHDDSQPSSHSQSYSRDRFSGTSSSPCKDFVRGNCTRSNCRFSHSTSPPRSSGSDYRSGSDSYSSYYPPASSASNYPSHSPPYQSSSSSFNAYDDRRGGGGDSRRSDYPSSSSRRSTSSQPCRDFTRGKCTRGDACRYSHSDDRRDDRDDRDNRRGGAGDNRRNQSCRDFRSGRCTRGTSCKFSHEEGGDSRSDDGSSRRRREDYDNRDYNDEEGGSRKRGRDEPNESSNNDNTNYSASKVNDEYSTMDSAPLTALENHNDQNAAHNGNGADEQADDRPAKQARTETETLTNPTTVEESSAPIENGNAPVEPIPAASS